MDGKMKTIGWLAIVAIVLLEFAGVIFLTAIGKDTAAVIDMFAQTLPVIIAAAAMFYGLNKVEQRQQNIEKSVNCNTRFLLERIDTTNLSSEEIARLNEIRSHNDSLVEGGKHAAP